ncbi:hypothetical protein ACFSKM_27890 [Ancylobacter dichloromethanicus]|uniref:Uncharacterized protein n=1 Tax=Ancylobacter dichloromethanicus TaxID=518825 RepID=A0A9W6N1Y9_9HYPH|nr:hypothetical protein [Ancylobacter dichloromethanicus]GLK74696.1 hypothetical protein GCM10017643_48150 [Ancylobacter dichloromethanicus]
MVPKAPVIRITLSLDVDTHRHLEAIAAASGTTLKATAAEMLRDLAADDAAAHGEGR